LFWKRPINFSFTLSCPGISEKSMRKDTQELGDVVIEDAW
jgi:hypothetical protein